MINITGAGARRPPPWIHHNYFHDSRTPAATAPRHPFRAGGHTSPPQRLVEHNLFVRCPARTRDLEQVLGTLIAQHFSETPAASSRCSTARLPCLRQLLRGTEGLRIFATAPDPRNYFEGNSIGINSQRRPEVDDGPPLTSHDRPDHCLIVSIAIANRTHYQMTAAPAPRSAPRMLRRAQCSSARRRRANRRPNTDATGAPTAQAERGPRRNSREGFTGADPKLAAGRDGHARPQAKDFAAAITTPPSSASGSRS